MALALEADVAAAPNLVAQALDEFLEAGRMATIDRWLTAATDAGVDSPLLTLASAELAYRQGNYTRAETLGKASADLLDEPELRARALIRAAKGAQMVDHFESALEL